MQHKRLIVSPSFASTSQTAPPLSTLLENATSPSAQAHEEHNRETVHKGSHESEKGQGVRLAARKFLRHSDDKERRAEPHQRRHRRLDCTLQRANKLDPRKPVHGRQHQREKHPDNACRRCGECWELRVLFQGSQRMLRAEKWYVGQ